DPAEERARQLAARAADAEATVPRLALAAALANQRGEAQRFAARARQIGANDPLSLLLQARIASNGPNPEDCLPIIDRIPRNTRQWMEGQLIASQILAALGLDETARARVERAAALAPGTPRWLGA